MPVPRVNEMDVRCFGTDGSLLGDTWEWAAAGSAGAAADPDGGRLYAPGNELSKEDTQMARDSDELAIERYRYLLRTAPPEEIERAHAEAFAALTPEQRQKVIEGLASAAPESELAAAGDDPAQLARVATRAELREPGTMERVYGQMPARGGFLGGLGFGGTFLNTLAGAFVGTAIASALFGSYGYPPGDPAESGSDVGDGGDGSAGDGGDGDVSDGGDVGGGDFGGGDFGGGDIGGFDI